MFRGKTTFEQYFIFLSFPEEAQSDRINQLWLYLSQKNNQACKTGVHKCIGDGNVFIKIHPNIELGGRKLLNQAMSLWNSSVNMMVTDSGASLSVARTLLMIV